MEGFVLTTAPLSGFRLNRPTDRRRYFIIERKWSPERIILPGPCYIAFSFLEKWLLFRGALLYRLCMASLLSYYVETTITQRSLNCAFMNLKISTTYYYQCSLWIIIYHTIFNYEWVPTTIHKLVEKNQSIYNLSLFNPYRQGTETPSSSYSLKIELEFFL